MAGGRLARSWRRNIALRFVIVGGALVTAAAVLTAVATWRVVDAFEQQAMQGRLRNGEQLLQQTLRETGDELDVWAAAFGAHASVKAYVQGEEVDPLDAVVHPLLQLWNVDFVAVAVPGERVYTVPGGLEALVFAPSSLEARQPGAEEAGPAGPALLPNGSLVWRSIAQVGSPGESRGYVVIGYLFGKAFADRFKTTTGLDTAVFSGGRMVASSLTAPSVESQLPQAENTLGQALAAQSPVVELNGRRYGMRHVPVRDQAGQQVATFSIIAPRALSGDQQNFLMGDLLVFVLELGVLGAICVSLATKSAVSLLQGLSKAMRRMGEGDLATPIKLDNADELGMLARDMEGMRAKLQATICGLAIEKSRYQGIFNSLSEAVYTTDLDGRLTSVNPAALALFNRAWPEIAGADCYGQFGLLDGDGRPVCDRACLRDPGSLASTLTRARTPGAGAPRLTVEMVMAPIRDDRGDVVGVVHIARDRSNQEELQRMKDRFLLSVAHELRTPVASLLTSVGLLRDDAIEMSQEDRDHMFHVVQRGALRLQNLVSNLLDLGSIEAGRFAVIRQPMDIGACLEDALATCEPLLGAKRQSVVLHGLPLPHPVHADSRRIAQVMMNLLANCSKYAPEGDQIEVRVWSSIDEIRVGVSDHGPGIAEPEASHMFEYFYQGGNAGSTAHGFGLGLAISKGIIDAHGGAIGVDSPPGGGATVWFTLPVFADETVDAGTHRQHQGG